MLQYFLIQESLFMIMAIESMHKEENDFFWDLALFLKNLLKDLLHLC